MSDLMTHRASQHTQSGIRLLPTFGAAIAIAIALHLIVTRPMLQQVRALASDLSHARAELAEIAGSKTDAWRTNDLLTALTIQSERVIAAEAAVARIEAMTDGFESIEDRIAAVAEETSAAMAVVDRFETLHDRIASAAGDADSVRRDLDDLQDVTDRIDSLAHVAPLHEQTLDDLHLRVSELSEITNGLIANEDVVRRAKLRVGDVVEMSDKLASTNAASASQTADELINVAGRLRAGGDALTAPALRTLAVIEDATSQMDGQSERLQTLVETANAVREFESELAAHIRSLEDVRRGMVDFAMLRPAMNQVVAMLRPLTDVARLQTVDATDLRAVVENMRPETATPVRRIAERPVPEPTPILK